MLEATQMQKVFRAVIVLASITSLATSCNGRGGNPPPTTAGGSAPPTTVGEALVRGEQDGILPSLNRDDTIGGKDLNNNGVRDDIERYIDSLADSKSQKAALRQLSAAIRNSMLINLEDEAEVQSAATKIINAVTCITLRYDSSTSATKDRMIEKYTVNTRERFLAYGRYNSAIDGWVFEIPEGDTCEKQ